MQYSRDSVTNPVWTLLWSASRPRVLINLSKPDGWLAVGFWLYPVADMYCISTQSRFGDFYADAGALGPVSTHLPCPAVATVTLPLGAVPGLTSADAEEIPPSRLLYDEP